MRVILFTMLSAASLVTRDPLAQRIRHTEPSRYRPLRSVHGGAGQMAFAPIAIEMGSQRHAPESLADDGKKLRRTEIHGSALRSGGVTSFEGGHKSEYGILNHFAA